MKPLKTICPPVTIKSKRIWLKKLEVTQAKVLFAYVDKDRKRLRKYLPWVDGIKSVDHEKQFIKASQKAWKSFEAFHFGIFRKSDDVYLGNIAVHSIRWDRHSCELGYWILGDFEGQGYISEAVLALESAMFKLGFNRVQIRCNNVNHRSANVPKGCGYKHEGTLRQDGIDLGKFRDTMVFGKIKKEWRAEKARKTKA